MEVRKIVTRHGKPLDIRIHKKDWLDRAYLEKLKKDTRDFSRFVLEHSKRLTIHSCCICGSTQSNPFGTTYNIPYVSCSECSHVYATFQLSEEDLAAYYQGTYFAGSVYLDRSQVAVRTQMLLEPKLQFVMEFIKSSRRRWLDVGCGNGGAVACARNLGFEADGIELGEDAIAFAQEVFGLKIIKHTLAEELAVRGPESYDIVSFFMVLEHVPKPVEMVRSAHELLSPGGILVIEVPKADSVAAMGDVSFPDQGLRQLVSSHLMNYTRRSLRYLVERNGFQIEGLWFMGQDVFNTLLHLAMQEPNFLRSPLCDFLLDHNNELQDVVDRNELSDEVVLVARRIEV